MVGAVVNAVQHAAGTCYQRSQKAEAGRAISITAADIFSPG
jgi:hypothetical protein